MRALNHCLCMRVLDFVRGVLCIRRFSNIMLLCRLTVGGVSGILVGLSAQSVMANMIAGINLVRTLSTAQHLCTHIAQVHTDGLVCGWHHSAVLYGLKYVVANGHASHGTLAALGGRSCLQAL